MQVSKGEGSEEDEEGDAVATPATPTAGKTELRGKLLTAMSANKIKKRAKEAAADVEAELFSRKVGLPDYEQRMLELGLNNTMNVHRILPHMDEEDCLVTLPFDNTDSDRVKTYWRWVYRTFKVLPRDVYGLTVREAKDGTKAAYYLSTTYFAWVMKEWYWTPSFVYCPEYVDPSQPLLLSWLSNGDLVLLTDKAMEDFAVDSDDEAANVLTFVGAFVCLKRGAKPDVRLVFQRSLSMILDCRHVAHDSKTLPEADGMKWFVNTDLDVMSWTVKYESDLSWRWQL